MRTDRIKRFQTYRLRSTTLYGFMLALTEEAAPLATRGKSMKTLYMSRNP